MYRVTADSNICISALLFGGKPLTLLEMAHEGQIELAVSDDLLTEALGVLRDKLYPLSAAFGVIRYDRGLWSIVESEPVFIKPTRSARLSEGRSAATVNRRVAGSNPA